MIFYGSMLAQIAKFARSIKNARFPVFIELTFFNFKV